MNDYNVDKTQLYSIIDNFNLYWSDTFIIWNFSGINIVNSNL